MVGEARRMNDRATWWMDLIAVTLTFGCVLGVRGLFHVHDRFWSFVALTAIFLPIWLKLVPAFVPMVADLVAYETRGWKSRSR